MTHATTRRETEATAENRRRLPDLIITRSPSSRGEIPAGNRAEREVDDRERGPVRDEQGDTGEVDRPPS